METRRKKDWNEPVMEYGVRMAFHCAGIHFPVIRIHHVCFVFKLRDRSNEKLKLV